MRIRFFGGIGWYIYCVPQNAQRNSQHEKLCVLCDLYGEKIVGDYVADIIVEDKVIIELKSVKDLHPAHEAQLVNYLKATGLETALLVNFGNRKVEYRRLHNKVEQV